MHNIAVGLDECQSGTPYAVSTGSHGKNRLGQVLEERTFAFAGAGNGQQVVAQTLLRQEDRHTMPCMTRGADLPAMAHRQLGRSQRCTSTSPLQERQDGESTRRG